MNRLALICLAAAPLSLAGTMPLSTRVLDQPAATATSSAPEWFRNTDNAALMYWPAWALLSESLLKKVSEFNRDGAEPPSAELKQELAEAKTSVSLALRASSIENADWGISYEDGFEALLPHLGKLRNTARLFGVASRVAMEDGDHKLAAEYLAGIAGLARHCSNDRILISTLVSEALAVTLAVRVEVLAEEKKLTPEMARIILEKAQSLASKPDFSGMGEAYIGERELALSTIRRTAKGTASMAELAAAGGVDASAAAEITKLGDAGIQDGLRGMERFYNEAIVAFGTPEAEATLMQLEADSTAGKFGPLAKVFAPSFSKSMKSHRESRERVAKMIETLEGIK